MTQDELNVITEKHKKLLNGERGGKRANLREADLHGANLHEANLRGANLHEADIDYSAWPLWCGSFAVKVCVKIARQLAYHFCRLDCDDPEYIQARNAILPFANKFHRAKECGELNPSPEPQNGF